MCRLIAWNTHRLVLFWCLKWLNRILRRGVLPGVLILRRPAHQLLANRWWRECCRNTLWCCRFLWLFRRRGQDNSESCFTFCKLREFKREGLHLKLWMRSLAKELGRMLSRRDWLNDKLLKLRDRNFRFCLFFRSILLGSDRIMISETVKSKSGLTNLFLYHLC